jgi:plasmid stabilization system protein ParE
MIAEFLDEARQELIEAALWYEDKNPGLGKRFRDEIAFVVDRIALEPFLWHEREGGYRCVNCPIFPYYLTSFAERKLS